MKRNNLHGCVPRVLHLVPGFRFGGIESLLMSWYHCLDKSKLQFDFIVDTCDNLPEFEIIRAAGGRVFQMGRYLDSPIRYQYRLNSILKSYGREYIALHSHTIIRALPVILAAKIKGIPKIILHSHSDSLKDFKSPLIARFIGSITTIFATDYWACSAAAGYLFFKKNKFKVIGNSIDSDRFLFEVDERINIRNNLCIKSDDFLVGHTGRFTYQKNHAFLIRVFFELYKINSSARLLLIGDGPLRSEIELLVAELSLSNVVYFAGVQSDVVPYLSAMDVFFLPSHYEGFCISLLEAQANGLRCLASDVIPNEVKITASVLVCSYSASAAEYAKNLMIIKEAGRANSKENINIIKRSGYCANVQASGLIAMYDA